MTERAEYVYFAQAGDERGPIKIGHSADVERRLESLRTGNHLSLMLVGAVAHERAADLERALHVAFADLRLEGEWFAFSRRILGAIDQLRTRARLVRLDDRPLRCLATFTQIAGEDDEGLPILGEVQCERDLGHVEAHRSTRKRGQGTWTDPWTEFTARSER